MSTPTGLFRGSRALLAAAKYTAACSTPAAPATAAATEVTLTPEASKSKVQKKSKGSASKSKVQKKSEDSDFDLPNIKTLPISPALQSFVGCLEISLDEACKKLWAHIEGHNLQYQSDELILDATLKKLFDGRDKVKPQDLAHLFWDHFVKK